jgi:hypothetical protein
LLSSACPQLAERGHGSWYFDCAVPVLPGRRERLGRGGYPTRREAIAARDTLLGNGDTVTAEGRTMQRWLRYWLTTRTTIRPTTLRSYEVHVERHLIPHLGQIRLSELTGRHITDMITAIGAATNRYGRTPSPSTLHRIRATLRSALNAAIREGLLRDSPARYVEVPSPRRPHALVWTAQRVEALAADRGAAGGSGVDGRPDANCGQHARMARSPEAKLSSGLTCRRACAVSAGAARDDLAAEAAPPGTVIPRSS